MHTVITIEGILLESSYTKPLLSKPTTKKINSPVSLDANALTLSKWIRKKSIW